MRDETMALLDEQGLEKYKDDIATRQAALRSSRPLTCCEPGEGGSRARK